MVTPSWGAVMAACEGGSRRSGDGRYFGHFCRCFETAADDSLREPPDACNACPNVLARLKAAQPTGTPHDEN